MIGLHTGSKFDRSFPPTYVVRFDVIRQLEGPIVELLDYTSMASILQHFTVRVFYHITRQKHIFKLITYFALTTPDLHAINKKCLKLMQKSNK